MNASLRTDDVMRYQDARFQTIAAKLLPTQYLVVDDTTALTTTLGSCVAACLRDPVLINDMLKRGAHRKRIEAKVFGGANVLKGFTSNPVGTRNAEFVRQYLQAEHIPIIAEDLCGIHPRKIWFFADTGRVVVQRLPHAHEAEVAATESAVRARLSKAPVTGGVELFE
jgi:chemotaxis protein CheD